MKQQTLATVADQGFENYRKPTRRDEFLKTMEVIEPWSVLCEAIEPHYPKAGNGRPPIGLERMLRIHPSLLRARIPPAFWAGVSYTKEAVTSKSKVPARAARTLTSRTSGKRCSAAATA